jgi:nucleoside-diphosphate-sugar epimerase
MSGATLVTGAAGFIGAATVAALRAAALDVKAGVRRGVDGATLCDLDRPETLAPALAGVDLVVHAAYGDVAAMPAQTQALLAAMTQTGARALILLSSIAVYGAAEGAIDESAALSPADAYGAAKVACEDAARAWAAGAPERRAILLRPGIVYGAGSRFWTIKLAERIRAGAWGDFGPRAEGPAALIHVDDLSAMIVQLVGRLRAGEAPAGCLALNAVGPERPSWNAYFAALARHLGRPSPRRWSEGEIRRRVSLSLPAKFWRRLGLPGLDALALAPTSGELALFARRASYETDAARALGLEPRIGLGEGLRRTGAVGA